jgi:hypothetical protein
MSDNQKLNGVMIIPTGLACQFGGDAGFNPGIRLIAQGSNHLIINPNAVNASDLNEMTLNCLYVEGSSIDRFLHGGINLRKTKTQNKILMVVNPPIVPDNINSANAGISTLGAKVEILALNTPLYMKAIVNTDGSAGGIHSGVEELIEQVRDLEFDALAIQTMIDCDPEVAQNYWDNGGVNPWGKIEAMVSKLISEAINKPVAHAPVENYDNDDDMLNIHHTTVVKPQNAAEAISATYTFCILKGLNKAPKIETRTNLRHENILTCGDIDFLVTPHGCFGEAHRACLKHGIPIIVVEENTTCFSKGFKYPTTKGMIFVKNYLEASGVIQCMSAGVDFNTVIMPRQL